MRRKFFRRQRHALLWTMLVTAIVATGAYAYTTNIGGLGSPPPVGSGSGAIGTYTASNVVYTLDNTNPLNLNQVVFNLQGATAGATPSTVRVQLAAGGPWYTCTVAAGVPPVVTCATTSPQATAAAAVTLSVAAAN